MSKITQPILSNFPIQFIKSDFEQPFTNGLICPLATAARRVLPDVLGNIKNVKANVLTLEVDDLIYEVEPPFSHEVYQNFKNTLLYSFVEPTFYVHLTELR